MTTRNANRAWLLVGAAGIAGSWPIVIARALLGAAMVTEPIAAESGGDVAAILSVVLVAGLCACIGWWKLDRIFSWPVLSACAGVGMGVAWLVIGEHFRPASPGTSPMMLVGGLFFAGPPGLLVGLAVGRSIAGLSRLIERESGASRSSQRRSVAPAALAVAAVVASALFALVAGAVLKVPWIRLPS